MINKSFRHQRWHRSQNTPTLNILITKPREARTAAIGYGLIVAPIEAIRRLQINMSELKNYLPQHVIKKRIRKTAIRRVRKDLILNGKKETDMSAEDLEYLVADAEKDVISDIKQTGLIGALALLGINLF